MDSHEHQEAEADDDEEEMADEEIIIEEDEDEEADGNSAVDTGFDAEMLLKTGAAARDGAAAAPLFGQTEVGPTMPPVKQAPPAPTEESSSDDSDSDDSDDGKEAPTATAQGGDDDAGSDDGGPEASGKGKAAALQAPRTKNEILPEELPCSELLVQLDPDEELQLAAKVCSVMGRTVVMQALPGLPPLSEGSVLCLDRAAAGGSEASGAGAAAAGQRPLAAPPAVEGGVGGEKPIPCP